MKPNNYNQTKKVINDWTDEKSYPIQLRILKTNIRLGTTVDKVLEIIFVSAKYLVKGNLVSIHKRELHRQKSLKRSSIKNSITHFMEKQGKMYGID